MPRSKPANAIADIVAGITLHYDYFCVAAKGSDVDHIFDEIQATLNCGIWFPALATTLIIPDACGTVEFAGDKPSARYIRWYDQWVLPHFTCKVAKVDGAAIYKVRNAMMHEASGFTRGNEGFDRIIFRPPGATSINFLMSEPGYGKERALLISIREFVDAVLAGAAEWIEQVRNRTDDPRNIGINALLQVRPQGIMPHFTGSLVIA